MKIFTQSRYATVASTLALVVAVGGTSYAAALITGSQVQDGTLTSRDVRDHSLKVKDIAAKAVTSLTGKPGPTGPQGPAGPAGLSSAQSTFNDESTTLAGGPTQVLSVVLAPGSYVVTAKSLGSRAGGSSAYAACELAADVVSDFSYASLDSPLTWATLSNQLAVTTSTELSVRLWCFGSNATLSDKQLSAIAVDDLDLEAWPPPN